LYLHLSAEDLTTGQGGVIRCEDQGPVTHQFLHDHLRPLHAYTIHPVLDPAHQAPVDAYEIPDRHRQAVHLITPADAFPFATSTSRQVDIDHTLEHTPAPDSTMTRAFLSRIGNYAPLGRYHHRIKTHGHWTARQPFPGILLWRDPHGQIYLTDHTGTHKITAPGTSIGPATGDDPDIELHPAADIIELDFRNPSHPAS
jgi:hypothetical protein